MKRPCRTAPTSAAAPATCRLALGLGLTAAAAAAGPALAQVTATVNFNATAATLTATERADVTSHLQEAVRRWARLLAIDGPRSIEIDVGIADIPTADCAAGTSVEIGTIDGRRTYELGLATELRSGIDPNGAEPDANVRFGLTYLRNELWFDPDPAARTAAVPSDRTDAISVAIHEIGHAIAYAGWADVVTGVPPAAYWSTFDRWMIPGRPTRFAGPYAVAAWGSAPDLTTGNNKHWGNRVAQIATPMAASPPARPVEWRRGVPLLPPVPAPPSIDLPAHGVEDTDAVQASLVDQLMNGVVFYRGRRYDLSPLDLAVLRDVGLTLDRIFANAFD